MNKGKTKKETSNRVNKNRKKQALSALLSIQMLGGVLAVQEPVHASASTTAPVVQVLSPVNNAQQVLGNAMVLTGTVLDSSTNIFIKYSIDGGSAVLGQTLSGSSASQTFKVDIPIPKTFSTGTHSLKVWSEDSDGNVSAIKDVSFEVNTYAPPTISVSKVGDHAKVFWATDILDSDVLTQTGFEEGQDIPYLNRNGFPGGQSIANDDSFTGERALKVANTIGLKGNNYSFPGTSSNSSTADFQKRKYIADGTRLSVSLKAKTDNSGSIAPLGIGGYAEKQLTFEEANGNTVELRFAQPVTKGQNYFYVTNPTVFKKYERNWIAGNVSTTGSYPALFIESVDTTTGYVKLNSAFAQNFAVGDRVIMHRWVNPVNFPSRSVQSNEGWKTLNFNTTVSGGGIYTTELKGFQFWLQTTADGSVWIDDLKFGYASEAFLYRDGQQIYRGYLSEYEDKSAIDKAKPNAVKNVAVSVSKQKGTFRWDNAVDNGTTYDYTIKAVGRSGEETPMSQPYPMNVTSGVKGYSVVVDKNPSTTPDNTVETNTNSYNPTTSVQGSFYVHVATVDNQGNVSDVAHYYYDDGIAPTVNVTSSNTQMTSGNVVLSVDATDSGSGVYRIQLPNGQWVEGDNAVYTVTENGNYTFLVDDHAGNRTTKTVSVQNIDKTAPSISVVPGTTQSTTNPIQLTITVSDSQTGVSRMRLPDGSWVNGNQAIFTAPTNGKYTFVAIDAVGNMGTKTFEVLNIANSEYKEYNAIPSTNDVTKPTLSLTPNTTSWTSSPITIQVEGQDSETGIFRIKMPDGSYVYSSKATFTTTTNGTFTFEVEDGMGNKETKSISISNIDRTLPSATLSSSTTSWTKNNLALTFVASDQESGVKRIQLPNGTWVTGKTSVTHSVSQNGNYTFAVEDVAGNVTTKSINVSNIDKDAPVVTSNLNTNEWTNQSVIAFVNANDTLSGVKEILLPNGSTVAQSNVAYTINTNGEYTFVIRDHVGNEVTKNVEVQNIDKTAPTLSLSLNTTQTSNNVMVQVVAKDNESGFAKLILPDGKEVTNGNYAYPVPANGLLDFTAVDRVGNQVTKQISVQNVDKTPPTTPIATADKTALTNGNVTVTATFSQDSVTKQYRIGETGTWTAYPSEGIVVLSNNTVQLRSFDQAGNVSGITSYQVTNIDKTAPTTPVITPSNLSPTKTSIDVSIAYSSDSKTKQYRINDGSWLNYQSAIVMDDNGKVEARSFDEVGNVSEIAVHEVTSIDKTPPADAVLVPNTTVLTNKDVQVTIQYPTDAYVKQYKLLSEGTWKTYSGTISLSQNDNVVARSIDVAGNLSNETILQVNNIDKIKPEQATLSANTKVATNQDVVVTATFPTDVVKKEYRKNGGSWLSYSNPVVMTKNGLVEVRGYDQAGNLSDVTSYQVNNIDKVAPKTPTYSAIANQNTFTATKENDAQTFYRVNEQTWVEYNQQVQVNDGVYKLEFKAVDEAENESQVLSVSIQMYGQSLNEAVQMVEKAESDITQENVNVAYEKVDAMPHDVPEYQPLLERLNDLQAVLNAKKAIEKATETRNESDVQLAQEKISLLNNSNPVVIVLMDDIQQDFNEADILTLVAKERYDILSTKYQMSKVAYNSLVQTYYAIKYTGDTMYKLAEEKVMLVPSTDKHYDFVHEQYENLIEDYGQFVEDRIQTDAEIKAEASVQVMEGKYDPTLAVNTQNLINAVEDATVRANLQQRLDTAKAKYEASLLAKADQEAITAVEKAESTKNSYYISEAYKKVNYLTNTTLKFELTSRLQKLEAQITYDRQVADATRYVGYAEQYKSQTYIDSAQKKIDVLPEGEDKTSLQQRLDVVKSGMATTEQATIIKNATNYVSLAQTMKTQYYVDKAQGYVNQITDPVKKAELQTKLDAIVVK